MAKRRGFPKGAHFRSAPLAGFFWFFSCQSRKEHYCTVVYRKVYFFTVLFYFLFRKRDLFILSSGLWPNAPEPRQLRYGKEPEAPAVEGVDDVQRCPDGAVGHIVQENNIPVLYLTDDLLFYGIGICGRPLCCHTYLSEFAPVSIKMAKNQGLHLNPSKISGLCGRLMCCLEYENEYYAEVYKKMPKLGGQVKTPEGTGVVISNDMLKLICKVKISKPDGSEVYKDFPLDRIEFKKDKNKEQKKDSENEEISDDMKKILD